MNPTDLASVARGLLHYSTGCHIATDCQLSRVVQRPASHRYKTGGAMWSLVVERIILEPEGESHHEIEPTHHVGHRAERAVGHRRIPVERHGRPGKAGRAGG